MDHTLMVIIEKDHTLLFYHAKGTHKYSPYECEQYKNQDNIDTNEIIHLLLLQR